MLFWCQQMESAATAMGQINSLTRGKSNPAKDSSLPSAIPFLCGQLTDGDVYTQGGSSHISESHQDSSSDESLLPVQVIPICDKLPSRPVLT